MVVLPSSIIGFGARIGRPEVGSAKAVRYADHAIPSWRRPRCDDSARCVFVLYIVSEWLITS